MNQDAEQLEVDIMNCIEDGMSENAIRKKMLEAGWSQELLDKMYPQAAKVMASVPSTAQVKNKKIKTNIIIALIFIVFIVLYFLAPTFLEQDYSDTTPARDSSVYQN